MSTNVKENNNKNVNKCSRKQQQKCQQKQNKTKFYVIKSFCFRFSIKFFETIKIADTITSRD